MMMNEEIQQNKWIQEIAEKYNKNIDRNRYKEYIEENKKKYDIRKELESRNHHSSILYF